MTPSDSRGHLDDWDRQFGRRSWGRYPPEELVRFVSRTFGAVAARHAVRILEVGCGPGANLWYLVREGFDVAGIDGSGVALAQARARLEAEGLVNGTRPVDLRHGDFRTLPWADDHFDAVVDIEAIYANALGVITSCIGEIRRVLKPEGWFFGKMFGPKTTGYDTGRMIEPNTFDDPASGPCAGFGITHFFTESELRAQFSRFSSVSIDWVHRLDRGGTVEVFEWLVTARK